MGLPKKDSSFTAFKIIGMHAETPSFVFCFSVKLKPYRGFLIAGIYKFYIIFFLVGCCGDIDICREFTFTVQYFFSQMGSKHLLYKIVGCPLKCVQD